MSVFIGLSGCITTIFASMIFYHFKSDGHANWLKWKLTKLQIGMFIVFAIIAVIKW